MKKFFTVLLIIIIIAAILLAIAHFGGFFPFGSGNGNGDGEGNGDGAVVVTDDYDQPPENEDVDVETPAEPQVTLIEIYEDRIIFDGDEVTLDELSTILENSQGSDEAWILRDALRADMATFDDVRELLRTHQIPFAEN